MTNETVRAELRAAIFLAIARLGEREARDIALECLNKESDDHYNRFSRPR